MNRIIIFDFNRTIYNPETKNLFKETDYVLEKLIKRGYTLYLISHVGISPLKMWRRKKEIAETGVQKYFGDRIILTPKKTKRRFSNILKKEEADVAVSFVVGDRVQDEIALGNPLGLKTVWMQKGKFSVRKPKNTVERPEYTITRLKDILSIAL